MISVQDDDYARISDSGSFDRESIDHQRYTLPVLYFPSELRVDDVLRPSGIEAYIGESDYTIESESEYDFEDAVSHFSQELPSDTLNDIDFDHIGPCEIPTCYSQLPRTYTNPFGPPTESKQQCLSLPSVRRTSTRVSKLKHSPSRRSVKDPNLITWDGPDDPGNPHNWPKHRRWASTILIAMFAFIAPMASTMVAPALGTIADE